MIRRPNQDSVKKILILKFGGVGDYVCLLPFLEDLRNHYEQAELTVITSPAGVELLTHRDLVKELVVSRWLYRHGLKKAFSEGRDDLRHIENMLSPPYDIYIDLADKSTLSETLKSYAINRLVKPKFSIGFSNGLRGFHLQWKINDDQRDKKHIMLKYNEILNSLGAQTSFRLATIQPSEKAETEAANFFSQFKKRIKIGLHPGASQEFFFHRAWPTERFARLVDAIDNFDGTCCFFVTGAKNEEMIANKVVDLSSVLVTSVPPTESVVDFCAYLRHFDYYIANDTGAMHLAVAMGIPTVGIFGNPKTTAYDSYPEFVPFESVTIDPASNKSPASKNDPRMLRKVSVDDVFDAFNRLWTRVG